MRPLPGQRLVVVRGRVQVHQRSLQVAAVLQAHAQPMMAVRRGPWTIDARRLARHCARDLEGRPEVRGGLLPQVGNQVKLAQLHRRGPQLDEVARALDRTLDQRARGGDGEPCLRQGAGEVPLSFALAAARTMCDQAAVRGVGFVMIAAHGPSSAAPGDRAQRAVASFGELIPAALSASVTRATCWPWNLAPASSFALGVREPS